MKEICAIIITIIILGCKDSNPQYNNEPKKMVKSQSDTVINKPENKFSTFIKIDTSYTKPKHFNDLIVVSPTTSDTLLSACSCDKNVKDNSIKIQIKTAIPTNKKLGSMPKNSKEKYNKLFELYSLDLNPPPFEGQLKYINFVLKDSIVTNSNTISRSSELEYDGKNFKKDTIHKYQIKISRFNYHNASKVYGIFKVILPAEFGFTGNDTIVSGGFLCMNWIINEEDDIRNYKFR